MAKNKKTSPLRSREDQYLGQYTGQTGGFGDAFSTEFGGYNLFSTEMGNLIEDFQGLDTSNLAADTTNPFHGMQNMYKDINFKNPYANIQNPYANVDLNIENTFEDLTVNQTSANIASEQSAQQRADMLSSAGGNLTAGMAQMLENQGTQSRQQITASLSEQESANTRLKAQGAADVQKQRKALEMQQATGAFDVAKLQAQGEFQKQQMEVSQQNLISQGQMQVDMAAAQGQMTQQQMIQAGAESARGLEYQKTQGLMTLLSSAEATRRQNELDSRSWWDKTFG